MKLFESKKMLCPNCQENDMILNKKIAKWECSKCGYSLLDSEFKNNYVFWFCDKCGAFLNNQKRFNIKSDTNKCQKCGYINDTSKLNIEQLEEISKDKKNGSFREWVLKYEDVLLACGNVLVDVLIFIFKRNGNFSENDEKELRSTYKGTEMKIKDLVSAFKNNKGEKR